MPIDRELNSPPDERAPKMQNEQPPAVQGVPPLAKALGFAASGGLAFLTDAMTLETLTRVWDVPPTLARLFAIALAMVVGWFAHRTMTFQIQQAPTLIEFLRYAGVAWTAAALNYVVFVAILWLWPETRPLGALVFASLVAMIASYVGMKFGVFTQRHHRD